MKTFCPNCEKETDTSFVCEVYMCNECNEDYGSYEKPQSTYWKTQAVASVKHMLELTAFLRKIMTLGLLRGSPRLRDEALKLLDGVYDGTYLDVDISTAVKTSTDNNKLDAASLEYAAKWIEYSLIGETNERVVEFGKNMAMSIRAAMPAAPSLEVYVSRIAELEEAIREFLQIEGTKDYSSGYDVMYDMGISLLKKTIGKVPVSENEK